MRDVRFAICDLRLKTPGSNRAPAAPGLSPGDRPSPIQNPKSEIQNRKCSAAFTLTEVIISVAIALLVLIGVHRVFSTTAQTIGAGNALTEAIRAHKAAHSVMLTDIHGYDADSGMVPAEEAPFLVISSRVDFTHRDRREYEAGEPQSPYRTDLFSFFARGEFPRQTANDGGTFTAPMSSSEAWIWYGHLRQPIDPASDSWLASNHPHPAQFDPAGNPYNYFAADWSLGRVAMLLIQPDAENRIRDDAGNIQRYVARSQTADASARSPLSMQSGTTVGGSPTYTVQTGAGDPRIEWARYDVAGTSIESYREIIANTTAAEWWNSLAYRFQANPYPLKPYGPADMARLSPILLRHCSDFIVEFAGDYDPASPGQIDMVIDATGQTGIRWYGLPRDTNGDGTNDVDMVATAHGPQLFERGQTANTYLVAWGPAELDAGLGPQLIRLTVRVIDPRNRLQEGVTQEFVFKTR
jgi:hypothetical protein